jgi:hypothetical protein
MRKIKALLIAAVFTAIGASAFAADATVTFVSGKVEVQRGGKWVALQKGDTVSKSETISTGFQSEAKIKILESVMYLGPVTRITLEELSSTDKKDNVNVYLKTGTARSQVKHVDNKRVNYQVHTAVAVASCRGTGWIIDDANNVDCVEGIVAVAAYRARPAADIKVEAGAKGDATEGEDENDTPLSDDGVLVQANQSVTVSVNTSVSAPVNEVIKNIAAVTGNLSTTVEKEAEGGAGVGGGSGGPAGADDAGAGDAGAGHPEVQIETADVGIEIGIPSEN